jgi:hypothetical protein
MVCVMPLRGTRGFRHGFASQPPGGTRQRCFDGNNFEPRNLPACTLPQAQVKTRRLGEGAVRCDRRPPQRMSAGDPTLTTPVQFAGGWVRSAGVIFPVHAVLGGVKLAFIAPSAMEPLFAVRWHIPEAAHHHAHGFVLRKENRPA